ncbi:response regulator, partial [Providencia sp. NPDC089923]|uniref:response regulator n=1 Tax=Providencia sp. NPDC089923 TaxID=3415004 RepID=UPI003C3021BE
MQKIKVLYVEDDLQWREGIQSFFQHHEHIEICACATTIAECFSILEKEQIDIVIMDILLNDPQQDGLDATLDIVIQYPAIKIIMLSSLDNEDEIFNEAFLNGAYDYLYKYDFEQLPKVINDAMSNRSSKYGIRLKKLVYEQKRQLLNGRDQQILLLIYE